MRIERRGFRTLVLFISLCFLQSFLHVLTLGAHAARVTVLGLCVCVCVCVCAQIYMSTLQYVCVVIDWPVKLECVAIEQ